MEMKNLFVKLMATLWENTYRIVINDQNDQYVATGRVVEPQLLVLVEDGDLDSNNLIEFETILAAKIREKFNYEIMTVFFYYPSPEDVLNKGTIDQA